MEELKRLLEIRCATAGAVWIKKARAGSPADKMEIDRLMRGCAAVINGICLSGGCTAGAVGDAVELERRGVPTVTLCHAEFETSARQYAASLGLPDLPFSVYPAPNQGNIGDTAEAVAAASIEQILEALTKQ